MEQAHQDKNFTEAKRLAGEIKAIAAEMQAKRAEREKAEEAAPKPTPEIKPVIAAQPTPVESAEPAEADQGSPYAKDVERLVKQRDSETAQAIAPIQKRFDLAAQQLLRKATQAGNLDAANKITDAIKNPPDLATLREEAQSPLAKEFLRLAEQREKDSATAVAPAQKRFDLAAQQLIRKATQAGNLDAANELKTMIDEVSGSPKATKSASTKSTFQSSKASSNVKESPESDFEINFIDSDSVEIAKYIGKNKQVRVPAMIQGKRVVSLGPQSFMGCLTIQEVVLPDGIQAIKERSFYRATNLEKINIPDSVTSLEGHTFVSTKLKEINIPKSVRSISYESIFYAIQDLQRINVDPANENYASIDGILYNKDITELLYSPADVRIKILKIPNTVNKINNRAFAFSSINTISMPKNLDVGEAAFFKAKSQVISD